MKGADPNVFALHVRNSELTKALKRLRRIESPSKLVSLRYDSETLTISIGRTSEDVSAEGKWPPLVSVSRDWVEALGKHPLEAAITRMQLADGMLETRGFRVKCYLGSSAEQNEARAFREAVINEAHRILARYMVTVQQISDLIDDADSEKARLWGANDGRLVDDVAKAWKILAIYGVVPSDIRRLLDRKSRKLWDSRPEEERFGPLAHYKVTLRDVNVLIEHGDPLQAALWGRKYHGIIDDIVQAWRQLVIYGVEPSDIHGMIDLKSR